MARIPGEPLRLGKMPKPPEESKAKQPFIRKALTLPTDLWEATCLRALEEDMAPQQWVALALRAFLKTEPTPPQPTCEGYEPQPTEPTDKPRCESGWTGDRCTKALDHKGPHSNERLGIKWTGR
jgi:hypothetical protein